MNSTSAKRLVLSAACAFAVLASPWFTPAQAQGQTQEEYEQLVEPVHTADSLQAKARIYAAKAAEYKRQAELHQEAARRFREERDAKGRPANPRKDVAEMDARCKTLAAHALLLAKDAELLAAFYQRQAAALK
jgi:hypothetical protein